MSNINMIENVAENLQSRMRTLECTNAIMHAMLRGEKTAVCHAKWGEIKLHHGEYIVKKLPSGAFQISWK